MSFQQPLSPDLEAKAQELVARLRPQAENELLALARLLVSKEDRELFGETEFQARDIVHRIGAKAFETHLALKKTATKAPESPVATASKEPSSKATAVSAGLLLLRSLWPRDASLGRKSRLDGAFVHPRDRAPGQFGWRFE